MTSDETVNRIHGELAARLMLDSLRPVCRGLARARQQLCIGREAVCSDEVLIEEARYASEKEMNREITSLIIKIGMFSPFERTSTPPPKYYFPSKSGPAAFFVTSAPQVSLAMALAGINNRYPKRYTWDRLGFIRDRLVTVKTALAAEREKTRNPLRLARAAAAAARTQQPQAINRRERMQLAAFLALCLRQKHHAGIVHNNLSPDTVFFSDALSPRLLNNYSGVTPSFMAEYIPPEILRPGPESTFGAQSVDIYSLGLITYSLLVGEPLDGPAFCLDRPEDLPREPVRLHIRRFGPKLVWLNRTAGFVEEVVHQARTLWTVVGAVFDESAWPRFRMLCRATGSILYSIPGAGLFLASCMPPRAARALRAILDKKYNEAAFGAHARLNRNAPDKRNADCDFLLDGLLEEKYGRTARIAQAIQEVIDRTTTRPPETADNERTGTRPPRWSPAGRHAPMILLTVVLACSFFLADTEVIRSSGAYGAMIDQARKKTKKHGHMSVAPEAAARQADQTGPSGIRAAQGREQEAYAAFIPRCQAFLVPVPQGGGVYQIVNVAPDCRLGDVLFMAAGEKVMNLRAMAGPSSRYYFMKKTARGYGDIVPVRLCMRSKGPWVKGQFYAETDSEMSRDTVAIAGGDFFAFNRIAINRFKNKQ